MKKILLTFFLGILFNYTGFSQVILSENFDGAVFPPAGWKTERVYPSPSSVDDIWKRQTQAGSFTVFLPYSGNGMAVFQSSIIISGNAGDLATPALNFSDGKKYKVKFRTHRQFPFRSGNDKITVYVNTAQTSVNATELALVYRARVLPPAELIKGWIEYEANIPASFNSATNYIIFKGTGGYGDDMGLDDVVVEAFDCNVPVNIDVSNITENSATCTWQPPVNALPLSYSWEVRFAGSPGSGLNGLQQSGTTSANSIAITGLKSGTDYSLYVKGLCNAGSNAWLSPKKFTTNCTIAKALPYLENFDSTMYPSLPSCFVLEDKLISNFYRNEWAIRTNPFNATSSGENSFGCVVAVSNDSKYDNWFFLPAFEFQQSKLYELSFQNRAELQNGFFEIRMGKAALADSMAIAPLLFVQSNPNQPAMAKKDILFEVPAEGKYYIGFHIKNTGIPTSALLYQIFIDDVSVKEKPSTCFLPSNIAISSVTTTSAGFSWAPPVLGSPSNYKWELRTTGMPGTGATGLVSSGTTASSVFSTTVTGLQSGAKYYFYLQSKCSAVDSSAWFIQKEFSTLCSLLPLPYTEYFDNITATQLPICSKVLDYNTDGKTWTTFGFSPPGGSNPNALIYEDLGNNNADDWWFTPPLNMPAANSYRLNFRYAARYQADSLEVRYGNSPDPAKMQKAALVKLNNITNSSYGVANINFTPQTEGPLYIGFHYISRLQASSLYIDNIILTSNGAVSCSPPLNLNVVSVEADSIIIKWSKPVTYGAVTGYKWEARTDENPGITGVALLASGTVTTIDSMAVIKGLPQNKNFNFYFSSVCSAVQSAWAGPLFMSIPCGSVSLPYLQNFDLVTAPAIPSCITLKDGNNDGANWKTLSISQEAGSAQSSPNCMYFFNDNFNQTPSDDWFFLPAFVPKSNKTYRVTFSYKSANNIFPEALQIKYGNQPTALAMTGLDLFNNNTIKNIDYKSVTVSISPATLNKIHVGFRCYTGSPGAAGLYIDNIEIIEVNACSYVPASITSTNISTNAATIQWSSAVVADSVKNYSWEIRTGGAAGSGSVGLVQSGTTTASNLALTNLSAGTPYFFYVKSVCNNNQEASWTAAHSFTMACQQLNLPVLQNFDVSPANTFVNCLYINDANNDGKTWAITGTEPKSTPQAIKYTGGTAVNDWFFIGPVAIDSTKTYSVLFSYKTTDAINPVALQIKTGTLPAPGSMTNSIYNRTNLAAVVYELSDTIFKPASSGNVYLGFQYRSTTAGKDFWIDDIQLKENITTPVINIQNGGVNFVEALYPNPVKNEFTLQLNKNKDFGKATLLIKDLTGRIIKNTTISLTNSVYYSFKISEIPAGVYIIELALLNKGEKWIGKIIKQ